MTLVIVALGVALGWWARREVRRAKSRRDLLERMRQEHGGNGWQ